MHISAETMCLHSACESDEGPTGGIGTCLSSQRPTYKSRPQNPGGIYAALPLPAALHLAWYSPINEGAVKGVAIEQVAFVQFP
jgi:hypothetical protein